MIKRKKRELRIKIFLLITSIMISLFFLEFFSRLIYIHLFYDSETIGSELHENYFKLNYFDLDNSFREPPQCTLQNEIACDYKIYNYTEFRNKKLIGYFNSLGVRDFEYSNQFNNCLEIAMLGDSVMAAVAVEHNETIPFQLETILQKKIHKNKKSCIKVYNVGIGGYNNYQEYYLLKDFLKYVKPDIVILNIVMNDIMDQTMVVRHKNHDYLLFNSLNFRSFLNLHELNKSFFFRLLNIIFNSKNHNDWSESSYFYYKNAKAIKNIQKISKKNNAEFFAVIYPLNESDKFGDANSQVFNFRKILNGIHAQYLELFDYVYQQKQYQNLYADYTHFNSAGCYQLANKINLFLLNSSSKLKSIT